MPCAYAKKNTKKYRKNIVWAFLTSNSLNSAPLHWLHDNEKRKNEVEKWDAKPDFVL